MNELEEQSKKQYLASEEAFTKVQSKDKVTVDSTPTEPYDESLERM